MCDPITILTLVATAGSTLLGAASMKAPPAPELPATPAPTGRAPGATVRIGTGADELKNEDPTESSATPQVKQRAAGTALGGLGRSSLAL
jgi:hypothetical protein